MEHFQRLVEIVNDRLVLGIGSFNYDVYIVIGVLVADAAEEHGELVSVIDAQRRCVKAPRRSFVSQRKKKKVRKGKLFS